MANCINNNTVSSGVNAPRGGAGAMHGNPSYNTITNTANNLRAAQAASSRMTNNINNTINQSPTVPNGAPLTNQTASAGRSAANIILDILAADGEIRMQDKWNEANALAAGTTVGKASFLQNLISSTMTRLVNSSEPVIKYLLHFAGMEGNQTVNNKFVADFNGITANAQGFYNRFKTKYLDPLESMAKTIARQHGLTVEEVLTDIGNYGRAEHTEEANEEILRSWQRSINEEMAKGNKANPHEIAKWQQRIDGLLQHINDHDPVTLEGERLCYTATGWTNAEAADRMAAIEQKYGMSSAELSTYTQVLRDMYDEIQQSRAENGHMTQAETARLPDTFTKFLPVRTKTQQALGALNDAAVFNPGALHAREGIKDAPVDDGYTAMLKYLRFATTEHSYHDFALDLMAMADKAKAEGRDIGLRVLDYNAAMHRLIHGDASIFNMINSENGMAMVATVPTIDAKTGQQVMKKKLLTFDMNWADMELGTNLTGAQINRAFNFHERSVAMLSPLTKLTSLQAQTFTRLKPSFAPINGIRDSFERMNGMAAQTYELESGHKLEGWQLIPSYVAHFPKAMETLFSAMKGTLDPNSVNGRLWREYKEGGLLQEFTPGKDSNQSELTKMLIPQGSEVERQIRNNKDLQGLRNSMSALNEATFGKVLKGLDAYNSYFNNIASFTQFLTLRDHGVKLQSARDNVLQMMNLRQGGTWTPVMRAMFPFVKPTMQGAAAMFRAFGLAPNARGEFRPSFRGTAMMAGNIIGLMMVYPMARAALGEDKDGNSRMDGIPFGELVRSLPVAINGETGEYAKLPYGFGPMQVCAALVAGYDRMQRGLMTPEDYAAEVAVAVARNASPADWPSFAMSQNPMGWLMEMFTPNIAKPVAETAANLGYGGGRLTFGDPNSTTPMAMQGRVSTESHWHQKALWLLRNTGLDLAPEQIKHVMEGTLTGPLEVLWRMWNTDSLRAAGVDKTNAEILGPFTAGLVGASLAHGTAANLNLRRAYEELNKLKTEIRRYGIKTTDDTAYPSGDRDAKERWLRQQLMEAGMDTRKIEQYFVLERAESDVRNLSKLLKKQVVDGHWFDEQNLDSLRSYFEDYGRRRDIIFSDALAKAGIR